MKTIKMSPISYCFGVTKAIGEALKIRKLYPDSNIYFFGDLVHNEKVIEFFNSLNINVIPFNKENAIEKLESFQKGDLVIFSAHGHNKSYEKILIDKGITFFDTTCIKVKKNLEIIKNSKKDVIFVGKNNHPETIASLSYSNKIHLYDISNNFKFDYSLIKDEDPLVVNQTTLSFIELNNIFSDIKLNLPKAKFIDEICDASRIRQQKILDLPKDVDLVIVVGDKKSSNSTKLYELSLKNNLNVKTLMVNDASELDCYDLTKYKVCLLASGTSTPISIIKRIEEYLNSEEYKK